MTAVDVALAALYIMPCVIFFFFVKNDMLEKPDKSKEKADEQSKENNNKNKKNRLNDEKESSNTNHLQAMVRHDCCW